MENNKDIRAVLKKAGIGIWRTFSRNSGYKLLSLLIATLLWSYVISSNPSIQRPKTLTVEVSVTGQTALGARGLALLTDMNSEPIKVNVHLSVPQSSYPSVTESNVRAEMDLSAIRKVGRQQVRLRGTTPFGTVTQVSPEFIEVEIENQDQRSLPISVVPIGEDPNYWYDILSYNPQSITLTGPASLVLQVSEARVNLDQTGRTESYRPVGTIALLDAQRNEISSPLLSKPANSVSLDVEIYPTKILPVNSNPNEITAGSLPSGYSLGTVSIQPESIQVAGPKVLMDSLRSVSIDPVSIDGATQSFTRRTQIKRLDDIRNYSSESVNVSVEIQELLDFEGALSDMTPEFSGLADALDARWNGEVPRLSLKVVGPYSQVKALTRDDVTVGVDLSAITQPGVYDLPVYILAEDFPGLRIDSLTPQVSVVVTANIR